MRINSISLFNLGSYQGNNRIEISDNSQKNIVLIGGKNGAGKTTLFDSIRLCLYGHRTYGYELMSSAYKKYINGLINDSSKLVSGSIAYVLLDVDIQNGQDRDHYIIKRSWSDSFEQFEMLQVSKNGVELDSDSVNDFSNYILGLIPPELFNLYFFDGEQIAEFFLSDQCGKNLKNAFLTLCGYDNIAIILDNFNRFVRANKTKNSVSDYIAAKATFEQLKSLIEELKNKKEESEKQIIEYKNRLVQLEKYYKQKGGISELEWNAKLQEVKEQESLRESLNSEIKKLANDVIPMIILNKELVDLKQRVKSEDDDNIDNDTLERIKKILSEKLPTALKEVGIIASEDNEQKLLRSIYSSFQTQVKASENSILRLSRSERDVLMAQLQAVISYDKNVILENRNNLKKSLDRSKALRDELNSCSIEYINSYKDSCDEIEKLLSEEEKRKIKLEADLSIELNKMEIVEQTFIKATKNLDEELKKNSLIDLSSKSVLMLEDLLKTLILKKTKQVEEAFMKKLNQIKQKKEFISRVYIDGDFYIHAYKKFVSMEGVCTEKEIDKTRLSKGEKQVFIMSLYWALMTLSRTDVPFMIDTPFARIDSSHREKITQYFFNELPGQVFIFSTDEEVVGNILKLMENKIGTKLLLDNATNTKTSILNDTYFGDNNGF